MKRMNGVPIENAPSLCGHGELKGIGWSIAKACEAWLQANGLGTRKFPGGGRRKRKKA